MKQQKTFVTGGVISLIESPLNGYPEMCEVGIGRGGHYPVSMRVCNWASGQEFAAEIAGEVAATGIDAVIEKYTESY